jgi:hypothetical protein
MRQAMAAPPVQAEEHKIKQDRIGCWPCRATVWGPFASKRNKQSSAKQTRCMQTGEKTIAVL